MHRVKQADSRAQDDASENVDTGTLIRVLVVLSTDAGVRYDAGVKGDAYDRPMMRVRTFIRSERVEGDAR